MLFEGWPKYDPIELHQLLGQISACLAMCFDRCQTQSPITRLCLPNVAKFCPRQSPALGASH